MISDKSEPSLHNPNGFTKRGEERWHTLAGGIPLIEEYHAKSPDGKDEYLTAEFWWDATAHRYVGLFCADFVDQGCAPFNIRWQTTGQSRVWGKQAASGKGGRQNQITMSGEYQQNGRKYRWREIFIFPAPRTFTQTLFVGEGSTELKRVAVISATRIGAAQ